MKKEFLKINLLPKFIPNKYISFIIYTSGLIVTVSFVLFYSVYLPYKNVKSDLVQASFENTIVDNQLVQLQNLFNTSEEDGSNTIYNETIRYVESTEIPLRLRINQITSEVPDGAIIESIDYSLDNKSFELDVLVDSDDVLLRYIESIWKMSWVTSVTFTEAGPGSKRLTISFEVGEIID